MILLECVKINGHPVLRATDEESEIALKKSVGKTLAVECKRARSPEQHRKWFVTLKKVYDNQTQFKSMEDLREATLLEVGHSELRERFDGSRYRVAKSQAFHNCSQEVFQEIFDRSVDSWCEHFNYDPVELLGG